MSEPPKRGWDAKKDAILCNADGYITKRFKQVLTEIFRRYDVDNDGLLNDKELNSYAIACNGKPFDEQTLIDIRDNLPVTKDGSLKLEGFLAMYELQTFSDPNETWKDLLRNGFDIHLNPRPAPPASVPAPEHTATTPPAAAASPASEQTATK